jgi:uncharacterized membrane protein
VGRARDPILWSLVGASAALFTTLSLGRFYGFYSQEDGGVFSQVLWATLHGRPFRTTIPGLGAFAFTPHNYLGEHFSPLVALFLPAYVAWPGSPVLLVFQSAALALAALPLYRLVRERLGHRPLALAFALAWLISPYVWQASVADFHPDTFEPLFVFAALDALARRRVGPLALFVVLLLACKEDACLLVILIGLFAGLAWGRWRWGLATAAAGATYGVATFRLFMPLFGGGLAYLDHYSHLGSTVPEIVVAVVREPGRVADHLLQWPILETGGWLLASVGFLPLLSPAGLPLIAPPALERLLTNQEHINSLSWYYAMPVLALGFVASADAARRVIGRAGERARGRAAAVAGLLLLGGVVSAAHFRLGLFGPLHVRMPVPALAPSRDGWLWATPRDAGVRAVLAGVPLEASVTTTPAIVPHVATRFDVFMFPFRPLERDVILIDLYGRRKPGQLRVYRCNVLRVLAGTEYGVVEYRDRFLYLRRGQDPSRNAGVAGDFASLFEAEEMRGDNIREAFDLAAGNKIALRTLPRSPQRAVVYGPYAWLPPGAYEVAFRLKIEERTRDEVASIDVSADEGRRILAKRSIRGSDFAEIGRYEVFRLAVESGAALELAEFRVFVGGRYAVSVDRIELSPPRLALESATRACAG